MAKKLITISICIAILMMFISFTGCTSNAQVNTTSTSPIYHLNNGTVTTDNPYPLPATAETPLNISAPAFANETKLNVIPVNTT